MINAEWNKYIFNGKCPYTGKACQKDWDCDRRIAEEQGKIIGADYMLQRFLDVLKTEVEPQKGEVRDADSN